MRLRVVGLSLAGVMSALFAAWFLTVPDNGAPPPITAVPPASRQPSKAVLSVIDALPLRFESNVGQTDERARFIARGSRSTLFLTSSEAVLALAAEDGRQSALTLSFAGAGGSPTVSGEHELPGRTHYLRGTASEWKRDIASYARVRYEAVYPGVDVVFYGKERELEFDVVVAPEADPSQIAIEIAGATRAHIDDAGDLMLDLSAGQVRMKRPVAYQDVRGERQRVESRFVLSDNRVGFRVGAYDRSEPLVIDPIILFSTYFGGNSDDYIHGIGLDASGHLYVSGRTSSFNFPTAAALDNRLNGADAFVTKLAPDGSSLIYSTYLGGATMDEGFGVAVDSAGHAYVTGRTFSPDFPLTAGAYDSTPNGGTDVFLTKLSADGSGLLYSTLIGTSGHDHGLDVAVDDSGSAYILGEIGGPAFPLTPNAYSQNGGSSFLSRFNTMAAGAASLEYSTFTGISNPSGFDLFMDIAPNGDVVIAGYFLYVEAVNGFQTSRAIDPRFGFPSGDAAFLRVDTRAADPTQAVVYASYLGGGFGEAALGVGAGPNGLVCLVGRAESVDFPVRNAFQSVIAAQTDAFVAVFDTSQQGDASLVYSTLLGGFGTDHATHCDFDAAGVLRVAGDTFSTDFPLRAPFQATYGGSGDVFVATFDRSLAGDASLVTSSYYGGSFQEMTLAFALDEAGGVWVGGTTNSTNLPIEGAIQTTARGRQDGFLARIGEPGGGGGGGEPEFLVSAIAPGSGGTGLVTTVVHGTGFVSGATVQLRRNGVLIAAAPVKFVSGAALQAVFNLTGAATGAWDIVVTNPGGQVAVRAGAFQIEPRTPTIRASTSVVMNPIQRAGRPTQGYITYSNPTNVDVMLPIYIYFPRGTTLNFGIPIRHGQTVPDALPIDFSQIPQVFDNGTEQVMPLIVNIPPGHTGVIPFTIPEGCDPANPRSIRAETGEPIVLEGFMGCALGIAQLVFNVLPVGDCVQNILGLLTQATGHFTGAPATMSSWIADILWTAIKCAVVVNPAATVFVGILKVTNFLMAADDIFQTAEACSTMRPTSGGSVATDRSCVFSADPNAKYGPAGAGEARYITGVDAMTYAIAFENLATATAAAQDVVVTDTLDPARLNLDTFTLGPISFGGRIVTPPSGLSTFTTTVDLRPGVNLLLGIDARLDRTTNIATWRLRSLDPATGQPTTDPIAGFLPPNVISPEGEGTVMFTAAPVASLATQDVVRNSASIVFDVNSPIDTGEWTNAIDKMAPASTVLPLSSPHSSPSFEVRWSGTDVGSGVTDYTVFASVNGGPFSPWLSNTTATSGIYDGAPGNTYGFFSIARDGVGLVEAGKATPEALVEIAFDTQPPTTSASSPEPNAAGWLSVTQAVVALTAIDGDSGVREIVYRASGATTLPTTTIAGAAASVAISFEGETTVAFYAVDNAGNIEAEQSLVIRIDRTAPHVTCASNPGVLWPPNQKMVDVTTSVDVSDSLSGAANFTLLSATSNEPDDAFDDLDGWVIGSADSRGRLRAERMGGGQGRVYSLHYQGSDAAGNTATCSASVVVPHDRRR